MEIKEISKTDIEELALHFSMDENTIREAIRHQTSEIEYYTKTIMNVIETFNNDTDTNAMKNSVNMSVCANLISIMSKNLNKKQIKEFLDDVLRDKEEGTSFRMIKFKGE